MQLSIISLIDTGGSEYGPRLDVMQIQTPCGAMWSALQAFEADLPLILKPIGEGLDAEGVWVVRTALVVYDDGSFFGPGTPAYEWFDTESGEWCWEMDGDELGAYIMACEFIPVKQWHAGVRPYDDVDDE